MRQHDGRWCHLLPVLRGGGGFLASAREGRNYLRLVSVVGVGSPASAIVWRVPGGDFALVQVLLGAVAREQLPYGANVAVVGRDEALAHTARSKTSRWVSGF